MFLNCQEQASVSVKRGYICKEKSSISSIVMYLAYMLFHWQPWKPRTITDIIKMIALFYFIMFKLIYLKYVHYEMKSKAIISHDWCDVLRLCFASSFYVAFSHLLRIWEDVGICWNMLE